MKILITGGCGFIFSFVSERLSADGHQVDIVDAMLDGSHPELLTGNDVGPGEVWTDYFELAHARVHRCRCQDLEDYDLDYDVIIHAAAESNVDKSIGSVAPFIESNINGTIRMLEVAKQQENLKAFFIISTDEVSGSSFNYQDGSITDPQNPYSSSKAAAGHFCWAYANTYGIPVQEVRMCNVIGRRQATTKLIPKSIELISENKPVPIYGDGLATREYIDVRDVCDFFSFLIKNHYDLNGGKINEWFGCEFKDKLHLVTVNQELSILEVLAKISQELGKPFSVIQSERLGHDLCYRMKPSMTCLAAIEKPKKFNETITWMKNA